jgi:hypothetical protein
MTDTGASTLAPSADGKTPGGASCGGKSTHFFEPEMHAFHLRATTTRRRRKVREGR